MLISALCQKCREKVTTQNEVNKLFTSVNLTDDNIYLFECPNGHIQIQTIQDFKFEILFESGVQAIYQSYYLESVLSLTSAYERFHEFFLNIAKGYYALKDDNFKETFNLVSKQSERQLGGFLFSYLYLFKKTPPKLNNKNIEFRNSVVHKGVIPKEIKVIEYAKAIHDYIWEIIETIKSVVGSDLIIKVRGEQVKKVHDLLRNKGIGTEHAVSVMASKRVLDIFQEWEPFENKFQEGREIFEKYLKKPRIYKQLELDVETVKRINNSH